MRACALCGKVLDAQTCLPPEFVDPTTGRACMLLGIDSASWVPHPMVPNIAPTAPTVPTARAGPIGAVVQIVTARLLTLNQWRDSQEFAVGKRPLAARFGREGTHHVSSIVVALRPIIKRDQHGASVAGDRISSPKNTVVAPDESWTVIKLIERVGTGIRIDAAAKPRPPPRVTVPALIPPRQVPSESGVTVTTPAAIGSMLVAPVAPPPSKTLTVQAGGTSAGSATPAPAVPTLDLMQPTEGAIADYDPPVTSGVIVNALESSDIATPMCAIGIELRKLLAPNSTAAEFSRSAAQSVYGVLGTQSQLYGWQHVRDAHHNVLANACL